MEVEWRAWWRVFYHRISSGTLRVVLVHSHRIAVISAYMGLPANMETLEDLQDTRITNANLLLPMTLTLRTLAATTCSQIPTEWRFCSLQGTALDFIIFSADSHPCLQPSACLFELSPNTDFWDQLFSLCNESSLKEQFPQQVLSLMRCAISCFAPLHRKEEGYSWTFLNVQKKWGKIDNVPFIKISCG